MYGRRQAVGICIILNGRGGRVNRGRQLLSRWKSDGDFKTVTAASGALAATVLFALLNGYLGVRHASLWHGSICPFYIVLTLLRGRILAAERRITADKTPETGRRRAYIQGAALLLLLGLCLIVPAALPVKLQKPVELTLVPGIAVAAFTTWKVIMASVNLKRRNTSADPLVRLLRTVSFMDALVSILTLQNTLIMVSGRGDGLVLLPLTAVSSGAILAVILLLSVSALVHGIRDR